MELKRNKIINNDINAPYKLPEGWKWVPLLEAFENITSSQKKIPTNEYLENGKYAIVDQGQDFIGGYTNDETKVFDEDLPVIIFGDHTKCIKYIDFPFAQGADGVKVLKSKKEIDSKFLYYGLKSIPFPDLGYRRHFPMVKNFSFSFPPTLEEQQRIVNRIETLFAKLDQAKEKAQNVVDTFETRKASILHKAFTGELTKKWREENGVGDDSWEEKTLSEVCTKITDGTHNSPPNNENGEYMYITAKNIKENGIDLSNITFVSKEIHNEIYSRCNVEKGDVLYIKDGATTGIATVNTLDEQFSLLSSVADLKPNKLILDSSFLAYVLNSSEVKAKMLNEMSGNAITRLTLVKIKQAKIPICNLLEQTEIVRILDAIFEKETKAKEAAEAVMEEIDLLKKSILARAFRGKL